jgi:hypothetical protein
MQLNFKISILLLSVLATSGCQSTSINSMVESTKSSWEEAKKRNAEKKAKWYYNNKPLMAAKFRNGKLFNVNGKVDTIDGFRDFKWHIPPSKDMSFIRKDGLLSYYSYNGQLEHKIGGAKLSNIEFVYFDNRLHSVVLLTNNDTDGQALLSALDVTFGVGIGPDSSSSKPWNAQYTLYTSPFYVHSNLFHYNKNYGWAEYDCGIEDSDPCKVTLYSKIEEYKHQEKFISQASDAAADF